MTVLARIAFAFAACMAAGSALAQAFPSRPEFTRFVDTEIVKWGKVITSANVKLD